MISLEKGQRISLEKNGEHLDEVCIGVNWGAIETKGFFGRIKQVSVDLDASVGVFDANNKLFDVVYFGKLHSLNHAITHSGDDLTGDFNGNDESDNETIALKINSLPKKVDKIAVVLNSFKGQDFKEIPFAGIRVYEGTPTHMKQMIANYDIAQDSKFSGSVSMVLGVFYRHQQGWKFRAVGEPTRDKKLEETLNTVAELYL
jgi:tellurium resistance protein TerZ